MMKRYEHHKKQKRNQPPQRRRSSFEEIVRAGNVTRVGRRLARTGPGPGSSVLVLRTNDGGLIGCATLREAVDIITTYGFCILRVQRHNRALVNKLRSLGFVHAGETARLVNFAPPRVLIFTG